MSKTAYIGITGVKTEEESLRILEIVREIGLPSTHRVMIGGLASYKGLSRGVVADPNQYVLPDELRTVFNPDRQLFNVVHYNSRAKGLVAQVEVLLDRVEVADGIQLNIAWPEPSILRRLRDRYYAEIVLQVSAEAAAMLAHEPVRIAAKLAQYEGVIDYALLDPSGGVGKPFDLGYIAPILEAVVDTNLDIGWGVAGGLGPGQLEKLESLLQICPTLSWDSQARLRTADGQALDLAACEQYLVEGVEILHKLPGRGSTIA